MTTTSHNCSLFS